jgi:hypothetical protein
MILLPRRDLIRPSGKIWTPGKLDRRLVAGIIAGQAGGGSGSNDPYFANVKALLHLDGTNGSTTYTDQKSHAFSNLSGSPSLSTTSPKFGTASLRLGVATNSWGSTGFESDFQFTTEFTFEFWYNPDAVNATRSIMSWCQNGAPSERYIYMNSSGKIISNNSWGSFTSSASLTAGVWQHIAITRQNTAPTPTFRLFIAGVLDSTTVTTNGGAQSAARQLQFGANGSTAGNTALCYIDDIRLTASVCRYTATFTPPAAAFPDS